MPRYGEESKKYVKAAVKKFEKGELKSGPKKLPVKSREQAIAIGLSKARKKGVKVPHKAA